MEFFLTCLVFLETIFTLTICYITYVTCAQKPQTNQLARVAPKATNVGVCSLLPVKIKNMGLLCMKLDISLSLFLLAIEAAFFPESMSGAAGQHVRTKWREPPTGKVQTAHFSFCPLHSILVVKHNHISFRGLVLCKHSLIMAN